MLINIGVHAPWGLLVLTVKLRSTIVVMTPADIRGGVLAITLDILVHAYKVLLVCRKYRVNYVIFVCLYLYVYVGSDCGQLLSTCNPTACGANGECIERTVDDLTIKICSCHPGYAGENCNIIVDNCTNNMELCFHRG